MHDGTDDGGRLTLLTIIDAVRKMLPEDMRAEADISTRHSQLGWSLRLEMPAQRLTYDWTYSTLDELFAHIETALSGPRELASETPPEPDPIPWENKVHILERKYPNGDVLIVFHILERWSYKMFKMTAFGSMSHGLISAPMFDTCEQAKAAAIKWYEGWVSDREARDV